MTKYSQAGPSSRYRSYQFRALWETKGYQVDFFPLLKDNYLRALFNHRRRRFLFVVVAVFRRLRDVIRARAYDVVVLEKELVPWFPAWLERLLLLINPNVVVDYDDAIYARYARIPILRSKIAWLMRHSRAVVAGNRYIAEYARCFNERTVIVPTVVDVEKYHRKSKVKDDARSTIQIVWIGTPVTARLLQPLKPLWQRLAAQYPHLWFKLIGAGEGLRLDGVRVLRVPWSEQAEARELAEADIGIMPLEDNEFQRGKCALKIIQYMAAGLPVVASPVGANVDVIKHGETGFLAATQEEWENALAALIENNSLREQMGRKGRERAEACYSLQVALPILEDIYKSASKGG